MIIGIDGNEANVTRRVGIGEYAYELLLEFYKKQVSADKKNIKFKIYLKDIPLGDMPRETSWWKYIVVRPRKLWTQIGLPMQLYLRRGRPDVFFTPSHYAPRFAPMPYAMAIMDLAYMHFPQLFAKRDLYQLTNWTRYSAVSAALIFTISQSTKNDIIQEYKVPAERVIVTYPGIKVAGIEHRKMTDLQKKYNISKNFVLFVGTLQPRKNIVRLIEAFGRVRSSKSVTKGVVEDLQLVIVGKKGWLYEEILNAPKTYGLLDSVKFLDFVPDEDLPTLYKEALFFVLPSLYEGFGLPVLEAMRYGCPVITSNISSLPEAAGEAAIFVDPLKVDDIAEKMSYLLARPKLREELRAKGYKQIKKFSWEKTARQTLDALEELSKRNV